MLDMACIKHKVCRGKEHAGYAGMMINENLFWSERALHACTRIDEGELLKLSTNSWVWRQSA